MVKLLPTFSFALASTAMTLVFIAGGTTWLLTAGAALAGTSFGTVFAYRAAERDRAMRRLVCASYTAGSDRVWLKDAVLLLGTPDVVQARTSHLRAEAERMAGRYANGDASDY